MTHANAGTATTRFELPAIECPEGIYRPGADSFLLIDEFVRLHPDGGLNVLDLCCGSGIAGISAASLGHIVTAVDVDPRAVRHVRRNALLNGVHVSARHGDLFAALDDERFDVILANPPYVPSPRGFDRPTAIWADGGPDGRVVIDRICVQSRNCLTDDGELLMVHSSVTDAQKTLHALSGSGFSASVIAERVEAFGPLMRERMDEMVDAGLVPPGKAVESLLVFRAVAQSRK